MKSLVSICIKELASALFDELIDIEDEFLPNEVIIQVFQVAHTYGMVSNNVIKNVMRDCFKSVTLRSCMTLTDLGVDTLTSISPFLSYVDCMFTIAICYLRSITPKS